MASRRLPEKARVPARAATRLLQDIVGAWRCQALHAAVQLQIPEHLADGPRTVSDLSAVLACSPDGLARLLRALCVLGVCTGYRGERFGLSRTGRLLCADPGDAGASLRPLVQWWGGPLWPMWGELSYSVRTGLSARRKLTGEARYAYLDKGDGAAQLFHGAQRAMTALILDDLAQWRGWDNVRTVVDVGGGHGQLALAMLARHRDLRGLVFDLPHAQGGAHEAIASAGLESRCRFEAGSFFEAVPAGADCYLLKSILHNWDEGVVRTDLNMLAGLGGRERTLDEYGALLGEAGLRIDSVSALSFEFSVIELRSANQSISAPPGS
ncbi:MAG: hypothetical protein KA778_02430 [Burkholderiaceae bacterium]|nr:hypothetical protein [Burkholderiaceae bacterium]